MRKVIAYTKRDIHITRGDVDYSRLSDLSDHDVNILLLQNVSPNQIYQERPDGGQYAECLEMIGEGDTIRVAYLDDISESVSELMMVLGDLKAKGIAFQCTANRFDNNPNLKYMSWGNLWLI